MGNNQDDENNLYYAMLKADKEHKKLTGLYNNLTEHRKEYFDLCMKYSLNFKYASETVHNDCIAYLKDLEQQLVSGAYYIYNDIIYFFDNANLVMNPIKPEFLFTNNYFQYDDTNIDIYKQMYSHLYMIISLNIELHKYENTLNPYYCYISELLDCYVSTGVDLSLPILLSPFFINYKYHFLLKEDKLYFFDNITRPLFQTCLTSITYDSIANHYHLVKPKPLLKLKSVIDSLKILLGTPNICVPNLTTLPKYYLSYHINNNDIGLYPNKEAENPLSTTNLDIKPRIYINSRKNPFLTKHVVKLLYYFTSGNIESLRLLAKSLALTLSCNASLHELILLQTNLNNVHIFQSFLENITQTKCTNYKFSDICTCKKVVKLNTSEQEPCFTFLSGENINKIKQDQKLTFKKLISGSTITYDDPIFSKITYKNNNPLLFYTDNQSDYCYLKNNFSCSELKIMQDNSTNELLITLTDEELNWIYIKFIPWGLLISSLWQKDITRNLQRTSQNNTIEYFMREFCVPSTTSIYPKELFPEYCKYYKKIFPDGNPGTQTAFIKSAKNLEAYNYGQIHIRKTADHAGSNCRGFKHLAIDTEKLNHYLESSQTVCSNTSTSIDEFEQILNAISNSISTESLVEKLYATSIDYSIN